MKKLLLIFALSISILALTFGSANAYTAQGDRLQGRILLQVEDNGEAWYIYPKDLRRYYLGRPLDAWNIMRYLGLGITDADLTKIPTHDVAWDGPADLINRLKGYILLQVEKNGEAWYVSPVNGKRYYMGRPEDAFQIMRNLGLGIKTYDLFEIDPNIQVSTIHYNGTPPYEPDEYVEIYNYGSMPQNMKHWMLTDLTLANAFMFSSDYILKPGRSVKIYTNQGEFSFKNKTPIWDYGDITVLMDNNPTLIDVYLKELRLLML